MGMIEIQTEDRSSVRRDRLQDQWGRQEETKRSKDGHSNKENRRR